MESPMNDAINELVRVALEYVATASYPKFPGEPELALQKLKQSAFSLAEVVTKASPPKEEWHG